MDRIKLQEYLLGFNTVRCENVSERDELLEICRETGMTVTDVDLSDRWLYVSLGKMHPDVIHCGSSPIWEKSNTILFRELDTAFPDEELYAEDPADLYGWM